MTSIIEGHNYDIFISYRQKDNKYDGWVTEFVDKLKKELEATFKEEISVYFDINPHDGLLETHDVAESLKDKLKCLIFIPIISRTYCDPKSFAWEHEFKAFVEMASHDQFGLKVKLPSGNVASRVLPVQIHDLDADDNKLCDTVLGGFMRGIEFIYKEPGVDRPLSTKDNEEKNLNKTSYRNQINKVALAIKEILSAIKRQEQRPETPSSKLSGSSAIPRKSNTMKILAGSILVLLLIIIGTLFIPGLIKPSEHLEKSIAVLPFRNNSPDTTNKYFIDGTMEAILDNLCKISSLTVISRTSVEQFRTPTISLQEIARKLNVNYILEGSGQKYGNRILLTVQLIDAANDKHIWSSPYEGEIDNIFELQSQIAEKIASELRVIITPHEENLLKEVPTRNTLAYDYYLKGTQLVKGGRNEQGLEMYKKAIEQDSLYTLAYLARANSYAVMYDVKANGWQGKDDLAKADLEKAMKINPNHPEVRFCQAVLLYRFDSNYDKALELLNGLEKHMPDKTLILRSAILKRKGRWEESLEMQLTSYRLDPLNGHTCKGIGDTYRCMRKYQEAVEFYRKTHIIFANYSTPWEMFYTILLWKGNLQEAWSAYSSAITEIGEIPTYPAAYYLYSRQYEKLIPFAKKSENQYSYQPKTLSLAYIHFLDSNFTLSRQYADSAVFELTLKIKESPADDRYYSALGYAYALKGNSQRAVDNAEAAVKLLSLKENTVEGFNRELDLAKVYILTEKFDQAIDKLEYLLTVPGELSIPLLKIDPAYDKLRNLPRFQKILATEYKTKY